MNYQRIYDELIADRRENPPANNEYAEVHHIIPRCMGGSDDADNLIRLRPEDHFFAHLLLAKAHGGRMWSAVAVMATTSISDGAPLHIKRRRIPKMRLLYGAAKAWANKRLSGLGNHNADDKVYFWRNVDGREEILTRCDMSRKHGIGLLNLAGVVLGNVKSASGWYLPEMVPSGVVGLAALSGENNPSADTTIHNFANVDGKTETCTRLALVAKYGLPTGALEGIFSGSAKSAYRWYLSDHHTADSVGSRRGKQHHSYDDTVHHMVHDDGREERLTLFEMHNKYGGFRSAWSRVLGGGRCLGWRLYGNAASNWRKGATFTYRHVDGRYLACTQAEFVRMTGLSRSTAWRIANGKTMDGWSCATQTSMVA